MGEREKGRKILNPFPGLKAGVIYNAEPSQRGTRSSECGVKDQSRSFAALKDDSPKDTGFRIKSGMTALWNELALPALGPAGSPLHFRRGPNFRQLKTRSNGITTTSRIKRTG